MRLSSFFLLQFIFLYHPAYTQNINSSVQKIIIKNCLPCHNENNFAPFAISSLSDIYKRKEMVRKVILNETMPPWKADTNYSKFMHTRVLDSTEHSQILNWLDSQEENKISRKKFSNVNNSKNRFENSIKIKYSEKIIIQPSLHDTTVVFEIPFKLSKSENIVSIRLLSTNWKFIHHLNMFIYDTAGGKINIGQPENEKYNFIQMFGWTTGVTTFSYSKGVGFILPETGKISGDIHFSARPISEEYNISFEFFVSEEQVSRKIIPVVFYDSPLKYENNDSLFIPANQIKKLKAHYDVNSDYTLVTICPHMHIFAKNFIAYNINEKDTIPLIKINDWDPGWQDFYHFEKPVHLKMGSKIFIEAEFDNTEKNPRQPIFPPEPVKTGWKITEEMFILIMFGLDYFSGDENKRFVE